MPTLVPVVSLLTRRHQRSDNPLREKESPISANAVTGHCVNVPIAETCQPTPLCVRTCYAASNRMAMPASLLRQSRTLRSIEADPVAFAQRVVAEYDRMKLTFLRWNGVGDLTREAVRAINWIGANRPDVVLWVVSRIPDLAAAIEDAPRVYVHLSTDRHSSMRADAFDEFVPLSSNWFLSYQIAPDEMTPHDVIRRASVVFNHRYRPVQDGMIDAAVSCPLNGRESCEGACAECRRCFDGSAVAHRRTLSGP